MSSRLFVSLLAAAAFSGCTSSLVRDYHYSGEGTFKEITKWLPGVKIPGYEIRLPEFDLSSSHEAEYKLGSLPVIPGKGNEIRVAVAITHANAGEAETYTLRSVRQGAGLAYEPANAPWTGRLQLTLRDNTGKTIWETAERIESMPLRAGWLGSNRSAWEIPPQPNTSFILRIQYEPDNLAAQLPRKARLVVRAGGSL